LGRWGRVEQALIALAADFDPAGLPTDRVVPAYEQLERIERAASSLRTLLAARVDESMHSTVAEAQRTLAARAAR
jgi:hypothetical protein